MARAIDADVLRKELNREIQILINKPYKGEYEKGIMQGFKEAVMHLNAVSPLTQPNESLPVLVNDEQGREYIDYICPRCKGIISQRRRGQRMETVYQCKFHDNCGQRVDWENQQPYSRPPKGET